MNTLSRCIRQHKILYNAKGKQTVVAEYEYHDTMSYRKSNIICKQNHGNYSTNKATKKDSQKTKKRKKKKKVCRLLYLIA